MKKVMIYDLWLCMIAWSLFLCGHQFWGILAAGLCSLYNCCYVRKMNFWRLFSVSMISLLAGAFIVSHCNIRSIYSCIFPFLSVMMFDYALINELTCRLKVRNVLIIYLFVAFTAFISTAIALMIPDDPFLPFYRTNCLVFVFIIFFPVFLEMTVCLLSKFTAKHAEGEKLYN
ncbi:MAG: hypothetical protein IKE38_03800 [Erysipelotrichaceae bacterium]|nr:hypothetical protein [Erysipelotrichaceae bacterium]